MPNSFAYVALFSWPLVALVLFRAMPPLRAMIWTVLGGYLLLPTRAAVDFPALPPLDKTLIPSVCAAVLVWFALRRKAALEQRIAIREARRSGRPVPPPATEPVQKRSLIGRASTLTMLLVLLLPLAVYYTNQEPIAYPNRTLPGMKLYDAMSMALGSGVMLLPFLLGRRYLRTPEAHAELLRALVLGGLLYSLFIYVEARLSPQLNTWLYGFFPHKFSQHVRGGHYRAIVFLEHGLRVGIFVAMAVVASGALTRLGNRALWILAMLWLFVALYFSRNLGALVIALALAPVAVLGGARLRAMLVAGLAVIVLLYPMIRGAGLVPTDTAVAWAAQINPARASSLEFRLKNEDQMLDKANQKPLFGWGGWGRARVYNEEGQDISTTDGVWVIIMGVNGWLGYLSQFGLLCLPLVAALRRQRQAEAASLGLALVLAANLIDMLPNSSLTPLTWLIAGALTGALMTREERPAPAPETRSGRPAPVTRRPAYAGRHRS